MSISDVLYLVLFVVSCVLFMIATGRRMVALSEKKKAMIRILFVVALLLLLGYVIGGASGLEQGRLAGMGGFGMAAAVFTIASLFMTNTPSEKESTSVSEQKNTKIVFLALQGGLALGVVVAVLVTSLATSEVARSFALMMPFLLSIASMLVFTGIKYPGFGAALLAMTIGCIVVFFLISYFDENKGFKRKPVKHRFEAFNEGGRESFESAP